MFILTFVIGLLAVVLAYVYYLQTFSRSARLVNKFPGPKLIPFLGNLLEMRGSSEYIFQNFRENAARFGDTFRQWCLTFVIINIITPEDAEIILTSATNIRKGLIYTFLNDWLGTGLLTGTGKKWQHRRKLLTPAFHFNILRKYAQSMGEHAQMLVENLKKECEELQTNVVPLITHTTLQIICETAMGTSVEPTSKIQQNYFQSIHNMGDLMVYRLISPWIYSDRIFNLLPIGWKHSKLIKYLHAFTTGVIKEREANFKDSDMDYSGRIDDGTVKIKRLAMLDLLISAKRSKGSIDDEGIREEVDTFMFEGHDTISVGISLALMVLANEKEHQEKIAQELKEVFGDSKEPATYEDLQKLPYLDLCLKECLRLYPSAPTVVRELDEDLQLTRSIAPAGSTVSIHIYDIHHDARNFPDPEKFDPERFLPENSKERHPFSYIPFSAGPRNCIGQKFAMLELKSVISAILRNYILEPVSNTGTMNFKLDFVLRNAGDINIKFKPRV